LPKGDLRGFFGEKFFATIFFMTKLYNTLANKEKRKYLRKNQTEIEAVLWGHLRARRFYGLKFHRQYSVGRYILDFYCPQKKIAIEVDGSGHMEERQKEYDTIRTEYLEIFGIKVFRVWNSDINTNLDGVLEAIYHKIFEE
jgi:very-short-patch-repair endonuclease